MSTMSDFEKGAEAMREAIAAFFDAAAAEAPKRDDLKRPTLVALISKRTAEEVRSVPVPAPPAGEAPEASAMREALIPLADQDCPDFDCKCGVHTARKLYGKPPPCFCGAEPSWPWGAAHGHDGVMHGRTQCQEISECGGCNRTKWGAYLAKGSRTLAVKGGG